MLKLVQHGVLQKHGDYFFIHLRLGRGADWMDAAVYIKS